jgi:lysophospholipase L1-like esterase
VRASRSLAGLLAALALLAAAAPAAAAFLPPHFGANNPDLVVAFGDSLTEGVLGSPCDCNAARPYPAGLDGLLAPTHPGIFVANRGKGGEQTDGGLVRFQQMLLADRPGFVLIMEGTNDAIHGEPPSAIVARLRAMVQMAKTNFTIPILGLIPPNLREQTEGIIDAVNAQLPGVAAAEDVLLVDTFSPLLDPGLFGDDDLHFTQAGYDRLAALWLPALVANLDASAHLRPEMFVETPSPGASLFQPFLLAGWAIERAAAAGPGVDAVHVYAFRAGAPAIFLGAASYGIPRPDVGGIFGAQFTNSGFALSVSGLPPGTYQLMLYAHSAVSGLFNTVRGVSVVVPDTALMTLDAPAPGSTHFPSSLVVSGWAADVGAASGTGVDAVHVYAFPAGGGPALFLGVADYGIPRPDVGAFLGAQFASSGYGLFVPFLAPGTYLIATYARSTVTGVFDVRSAIVTVVPSAQAVLDTPGPGASVAQPFAVSGWAIDVAALGGPGIDAVHVYAFPLGGGAPVFLGEADYGILRPDVAGFAGSQFLASGYGLVVGGLAPGGYQIVVFARSAVTGSFDAQAVVVVQVQ